MLHVNYTHCTLYRRFSNRCPQTPPCWGYSVEAMLWKFELRRKCFLIYSVCVILNYQEKFFSAHTRIDYWTRSDFEVFISKMLFSNFGRIYKLDNRQFYYGRHRNHRFHKDTRKSIIDISWDTNLNGNFKESSLSSFRSNLRRDYTEISKAIPWNHWCVFYNIPARKKVFY